MSKISIKATNKDRYVRISSNNPFFTSGTSYIIASSHQKLTMIKAPFYYNGKTYKLNESTHGWKKVEIVMDIPVGDYDPDPDESNEDQITIYFN